MLKLDQGLKIYLFLHPMDMRKSINGLSLAVKEDLSCNPQERSFYIFFNKPRNKIKCLYSDRNGFVLIYKRMEKGRFQVSKSLSGDMYELSHEELSGFDFYQMNGISEQKFEHYY